MRGLLDKLYSKKIWLTITIIAIAFAIVRTIYYKDIISENAFLVAPASDARIYHEWAIRILNSGDIVGTKPYILNPGYAYLLAAIYSVFGVNANVVIMFQICVSFISAVLVYFISKKVFGERVALFSILMYSLLGLFVIYEGLLVTFVWLNLFNLIMLLALLYAQEKNSIFFSWLGGISLGISALFRPNILLFAFLFLIWVLVYKIKNIRRLLVGFSLGIIMVLSPNILKSMRALDGQTTSGISLGINFFIGNSQYSDGSNSAMFKVGSAASHPEYMLERFKQEAVTILGKRDISYGAMDRFWLSKGLRYIVARPIDWLKIMTRKILFFLNFKEIGSNYPIDLIKRTSKVHKILPDIWLVLPLSCAILLLYFGRIMNTFKSGLLSILLMVQVLTVLIFFMLSEYRAPAVPIMVIFAAYALDCIIKATEENRIKEVISILLVAISFFVVGMIPMQTAKAAGDMYYEGQVLEARGDAAGALKAFMMAISIDANYQKAHQHIGKIYYELRDFKEAKEWFIKSIDIYPTPESYTNLGHIAIQNDDLVLAQKYFKNALKLKQDYYSALNGLAIVKFLYGEHQEAYDIWKRALNYAPDIENRNMIMKNIELAQKKCVP